MSFSRHSWLFLDYKFNKSRFELFRYGLAISDKLEFCFDSLNYSGHISKASSFPNQIPHIFWIYHFLSDQAVIHWQRHLQNLVDWFSLSQRSNLGFLFEWSCRYGFKTTKVLQFTYQCCAHYIPLLYRKLSLFISFVCG